MKKLLLITFILSFVLAACSNNAAIPLEDEPIDTFEVVPIESSTISPNTPAPIETTTNTSEPTVTPTPTPSSVATTSPSSSPTPTSSQVPSASTVPSKTLEEKFNAIDFYLVAGTYSRNVILDEKTTTEMFSLDKTNFIRISSNDFEQEIFAYNYVSDNFTYLYYFDNELLSKTIFNIDTGAILEDRDGYSELLKTKADNLKEYFLYLINEAGISISEID